jgi:hypothetical protein
VEMHINLHFDKRNISDDNDEVGENVPSVQHLCACVRRTILLGLSPSSPKGNRIT